jgi:hypothetical protein
MRGRALLLLLSVFACQPVDPAEATEGSSGAGGSTGGTTQSDPPTTGGSTSTSTTGSTGEGATSTGDGSTAAGSTGPVGCAGPPPCETCTCEGEQYQCHCPELSPEAGYVDVPAVDYTLGEGEDEIALSSSPARIFYSFHPADNDPGDAPLLLFFNGGPGVSSGMLLAGNTAPQTLTDELTPAPNPSPWTAIGHLLYVDARNTGFSYQSIDDPADQSGRSAELQTRNFNSYLDAADFARALLGFWDAHPELAQRRLIIVGESYGGIRASILLNMFLFPAAYGEAGFGRYRDPALADALADFLVAQFGDPTPAAVGERLGTLVLVQPSIGGRAQQLAAGYMFEVPGSVVHQLADEVGVPFETCATMPQPCDPWANAVEYVEAIGRSRYDTMAPGTWLSNMFARTRAGLSKRDTLAALLQVAPEDIAGLPAAARPLAFRVRSPADYMTDEAAGDLPDHFGPLQAWDRYYLPFSVEALDGFRGPVATIAGCNSNDPHYAELFLHDLAYARVFITDAGRDLAIWGPSIGSTFKTFPTLVAGAQQIADQPAGTLRPGELRVQFKPGAFPGEPDVGTRTIRMPPYDASHAVTYDRPEELRADVIEWLASP